MLSLLAHKDEFEHDYIVSNIPYDVPSIRRIQIRALHVHQKAQAQDRRGRITYGTSIYIMNNTVKSEDQTAPTPSSTKTKVLGYVQARNVKEFERIAKSTAIPSIPNTDSPSADQVFRAWEREVVERAVAAGCLEEVRKDGGGLVHEGFGDWEE